LSSGELAAAATQAEDAWQSLWNDTEFQSAARAAMVRLALMQARLALDDSDGLERARGYLERAEQMLAADASHADQAAAERCRLLITNGLLQLQLEQPAAALAAFEQASALMTDDLKRERPALHARQLLGVGTAYVKLRRHAAAEPALTAAKAAIHDAAERSPNDITHRRTLASVQLQLGTLAVMRR